jgi:N-acetylmuramoyl-L-alanine amidase
MSQAEDISAINDYFNRTPGKTQAAKDAKDSWNAWYSKLSFVQKSFTDSTLVEATKRRVAFDAANGDVKRQDDGGLTKEEQEYFAKLPSAVVTGLSPADAKKVVADAAKKGAQIPVPATLLSLQAGSLRQGSQGDSVKELQKAIGVTPVDGKFGPSTTTAVKKFQSANGLKADGIVGPATWAAIGKKKPEVMPALQTIVQKPYTQAQNFNIANAAAAPTPSPIPAPSPAPSASAVKPAAYPVTSTGTVVTASPSFAVSPASRPVLKKGMTGAWVAFWQKNAEIPVTNQFDTNTFNLTKTWQSNHGLVADGVVGAASWSKLDQTRPVASAAATATQAATSAASMIPSVPGMPTWMKWFLAVLSLGAVGYGISYSKGSHAPQSR